MKTILVPTDFSANAANALRYAETLALKLRAKLVLVHIIHLPITLLENGVVVCADPGLEEVYKEELTKQAEDLKTRLSLEVETVCRYGILLTDLDQLVKSKKADLVVMGTKGASNYLDKLVGSNTLNFMKNADCPVLAIPTQARFTGIRQVTYASDFKSEERVFLQQLFNFIKPFSPWVSIVNVLTGFEVDNLTDGRMEKEIEVFFPHVNKSVIQVHGKNIPETIHRFINQNKSDLLAIAMHQRSFIEDIFHKSVSKQLIYNLNLPLLTLPEWPFCVPRSTTGKHKNFPVK